MHAHYFISVKLTFVFGSIRQIVGDDNVGNSNNFPRDHACSPFFFILRFAYFHTKQLLIVATNDNNAATSCGPQSMMLYFKALKLIIID